MEYVINLTYQIKEDSVTDGNNVGYHRGIGSGILPTVWATFVK